MSRPISWLDRLTEIRRSVKDSVRSHYSSRDLEILLQVQPATARALKASLPTEKVGPSRLVASDVLSAFLDRVAATDDVGALMAQVKAEKQQHSRRKLRTLVQRDQAVASLAGLPENLTIEPGRVECRFKTLEELARGMMILALILQDDEAEFARRYEPPRPRDPEDTGAAEVSAMFDELKEMEAQHNGKR